LRMPNEQRLAKPVKQYSELLQKQMSTQSKARKINFRSLDSEGNQSENSNKRKFSEEISLESCMASLHAPPPKKQKPQPPKQITDIPTDFIVQNRYTLAQIQNLPKHSHYNPGPISPTLYLKNLHDKK